MSATHKRPGTRDISDLKARLGLKKSGPAAPNVGGDAAPSSGAVPPPGGVVPPPGVKQARTTVPAPPGARPPEPAAPSVQDDPFGAMNAMAAARAAHAAPEIIVVNDGKPVESVERSSKGMRYLKIAALVAVPLIVGVVIGQISQSAKIYNRTISDAARLANDMKRVRTSIQNVNDALLIAKEKGLKAGDPELTKMLADIELEPVEPAVAYHSYLYEMKPDIVQAAMDFYAQASLLKGLLEDHVKKSQADAKGMALAQQKFDEAKPNQEVNPYLASASNYRYGVIYDIPSEEEAQSGAIPGAKLVEIGPPVCGNNRASDTGNCADEVKGFGYRESAPSDGWGLMKVFQPQSAEEGVPAKSLVLLRPTGTMDALLKGSQGTIAEMGYQTRLKRIDEIVEPLIQFGADVEKKLRAKASEGEKFTFFL